MDGSGDNQLTMQYFQDRQYPQLLQDQIVQNIRRLLAVQGIEEGQGDGADADPGIIVGLAADVEAGNDFVGDLDFANAGEHFRLWHDLALREDSGFESGSEGD